MRVLGFFWKLGGRHGGACLLRLVRQDAPYGTEWSHPAGATHGGKLRVSGRA